MYIKQIINIIVSSNFLISCAPGDGNIRDHADTAYRGSDCISILTIRDYTPLDSRSLLIEGAGKTNYYVQLVMSSFGLRSSYQLGVQSRDDRLCPYGGDQIVVGGLDEERVGIRSISRLKADQLRDLLIRYGKMEPEEQPDPAPVELESAEVEELGGIT